ncbi:MAG: hypothetical protein KBG76_14815 [Saprospiraceae bacterium]|nr:hypothetical protein [Saprospiraceae bacterium]
MKACTLSNSITSVMGSYIQDGVVRRRVSGGMQYCIPPSLKLLEMFHTT